MDDDVDVVVDVVDDDDVDVVVDVVDDDVDVVVDVVDDDVDVVVDVVDDDDVDVVVDVVDDDDVDVVLMLLMMLMMSLLMLWIKTSLILRLIDNFVAIRGCCWTIYCHFGLTDIIQIIKWISLNYKYSNYFLST